MRLPVSISAVAMMVSDPPPLSVIVDRAYGPLADDAGHTMVEVVAAVKKVSDLIVEIAAASTPARPSTSSAPSSRQTRSESSTVVMPEVASCPS